jgi:hypothetical protein
VAAPAPERSAGETAARKPAEPDQSVAEEYDPGVLRSRLAQMADRLRPMALGALTRIQLADIYGRAAPELVAYDRYFAEMDAERSNLAQDADKLLQRWRGLPRAEADRLSDVMHEATLAELDPDTGERGLGFDAKVDIEASLTQRFSALSLAAKDVYRDARAMYEDRLQQLFQALRRRIERSASDSQAKTTTVDKLREQFDDHLARGPYFPLARFGEYVLIATRRKPTGANDDRFVMTFESPRQRDLEAQRLRGKGYIVKSTVSKEYSRSRDGSAGALAEALTKAMDGLDFDRLSLTGPAGESLGDLKTQLLDALNQALIRGLPDMSYRRHFVHRKGVPGFSRDAMRAFADSQFHAAHHIAKLNYGDQLLTELDKLQRRIARKPEGEFTVLQQVSNEFAKRHELFMTHTTHPVAATLGQLGFVMSLGGTVAAGVVNLTQTPLVAYPWLGSRYGFGRAAMAMTKAANEYRRAPWEWESGPNIAKSGAVSAEERDMLTRLERTGIINTTQAHDLASASNTDNLSQLAKRGYGWQRLIRMVGWTFHVPEVANRQITGLAAYRLARGRGRTDEQATEAAREAIVWTHFDYSSGNRARYFEGNLRRVVLMFKQYAQNIAYLYGRAGYQAMRGATRAEKREARRLLVGLLGTHLAAAGTMGLPFIGSVASIFQALANGFRDDDEDFDWEVEYRNWLARTFGKDIGEAVARGLPRLAIGWDVAKRVGQDDLFLRAPNREQEGRDAYWAWAQSLAGPVAGYALNLYLGIEDVAKGISNLNAGKFWRGAEELTPKFIRDVLKAARYEYEDGVRTRAGYKQLELGALEKVGQALGFTPSRAAEMYEGVNAIKNRERRIQRRRSELLDQYAAALKDGNAEREKSVQADIDAFNERNPDMAITGRTTRQSLRNRERREAEMKGGVYLPKSRDSLRDEGGFANF